MDTNRKWYIGEHWGEGTGLFFIDLTDDEKKVVDRFIYEQGNGPGDGYSGGFGIDNEGYSTREDAIAAAKMRHSYIFAYDPNWDQPYENEES